MGRVVVVDGTGKLAALLQLRGRKTGTAQKVKDGIYSQSDYVASFIGIVPVVMRLVIFIDEPRGMHRRRGAWRLCSRRRRLRLDSARHRSRAAPRAAKAKNARVKRMSSNVAEPFAGLDARVDGPERNPISDVTYDSRAVRAGALFVALRGAKTDGHRFLTQAIDAGASALLVEEAPATRPAQVAVVRVADTRAALADVAARFFAHPARALTLVGVTAAKRRPRTRPSARLCEETSTTAATTPASRMRASQRCRSSDSGVVSDDFSSKPG